MFGEIAIATSLFVGLELKEFHNKFMMLMSKNYKMHIQFMSIMLINGVVYMYILSTCYVATLMQKHHDVTN